MSNIVFCYFAGITKASAQENILVIHSYSSEFSWTKDIRLGIDETLAEDTNNIKVHHEFLDAKKHPKLNHSQVFLEYIQTKYHDTNLDLLMVSDDPGLEVVIQNRKEYFADIPLVYLGINNVNPEILNLPKATGVFENREIIDIFIEAKKQTKSDQLIVINDTTETGKANLAKISKGEKPKDFPQDIRIINDLTPENIQDVFDQYAENVPVLLIGQLRKNSVQAELYPKKEGANILVSQIKNPIYGYYEGLLGHGILGGKFLEGKAHANQASKIAQNILQGISVDQIKPIIKPESQWIFDAKELEKFNIKPKSLPKNSEIINQKLSFYQKYEKLVWYTTSAFGISLLIIFLLIEVIRREEITKRILNDNKSRYRDFAESGANIFWELDANYKLSYLSGDTQSLCRKTIQEMLGKSFEDMFKNDPNVKFPWKSLEESIKGYLPIKNLVCTVKNSNQESQIYQLNGKPVYDKNNQFLGYRGIQREITQEYNLSKTIAYQASYDVLTGLVNRQEFINHLKYLVYETKHHRTASVLCYLDLDRFKVVNDTAGHLVGDSLLIEVTEIISSCLREQDILGRLGGDEFGLLLKEVSISDAQSICQKIIIRVSKNRFQWNKRFFDISISIGIISILDNPFDAIELLSKADLACYAAKDLGRGRFCIAGTDNTDLNNVQMEMEYISSVSQAIEQQRFYLVKQQIKAIDPSNCHQHYEILLRYQDQAGNNISPGLFIPAAEKYGVISIIDRWVLATIIKNYNNYFPDNQTMISVNISGISISTCDFTEFVLNLFSESGVDPSRICFEITETAAISQLSQALKFISTMKKLKVKFALDDFGSGLSSFCYLKDLPVDYLKIDGSLIKNIVTEAPDRAIVSAIASIAQEMNIKTIAEFVEDDKILKVLAKIGVDYSQGYGVHKPEKCVQRVFFETSRN